jgi:hypothetical protein
VLLLKLQVKGLASTAVVVEVCRNLRDDTSERRNIGGIDGDVLFHRNDFSDGGHEILDWYWWIATTKNPSDTTSWTSCS